VSAETPPEGAVCWEDGCGAKATTLTYIVGMADGDVVEAWVCDEHAESLAPA
jgi:hypothetical protein